MRYGCTLLSASGEFRLGGMLLKQNSIPSSAGNPSDEWLAHTPRS